MHGGHCHCVEFYSNVPIAPMVSAISSSETVTSRGLVIAHSYFAEGDFWLPIASQYRDRKPLKTAYQPMLSCWQHASWTKSLVYWLGGLFPPPCHTNNLLQKAFFISWWQHSSCIQFLNDSIEFSHSVVDSSCGHCKTCWADSSGRRHQWACPFHWWSLIPILDTPVIHFDKYFCLRYGSEVIAFASVIQSMNHFELWSKCPFACQYSWILLAWI